jgi:GTP:adenosylcobinamide-phosphate guanylyltransferase
MAVTHVIVQAGGKGTRLAEFTRNKPKCLAPVDGRPLLYHTFASFPGAKFIVILDYKKDIVSRFLEVFPPGVEAEFISVKGDFGNASGLAEAAARIPPAASVAVVWCDLRFERPPQLAVTKAVVIVTTRAFPCRWSMPEDGKPIEQNSAETGAGIVGLFAFPRADMLAAVPAEGEFVAWLAGSGLPLQQQCLQDVAELGTAAALRQRWSTTGHARFFNEVVVSEDYVTKRARLPEFQALIEGEMAWYENARRLGFQNAPRVLATQPLILQRIRGTHPFARQASDREHILQRIMDRLQDLHRLDHGPASADVVQTVYHTKTLQRLQTIRRLCPEFQTIESFRINGTLCRNILHERHAHVVAEIAKNLVPDAFHFIHGDPTFSNILLTADGEPWFIDPRGQFGSSWFLGDANYDWAKLYYSVVGGYDAFNQRHFTLHFDKREAVVHIEPNGWAHLDSMFRSLGARQYDDIRLLHGLIWLSLSGYVNDDYDAILAAFFQGLLVLEGALEPVAA